MSGKAALETVVINHADHAIVLTTTLTLLRENNACASGYAKLLAGIGDPSFDHDAPINLLTILDTNGVADCLWALCATQQNCEKVARMMAADFAELVLPIFERERPTDMRPRDAINVARAFALGSVGTAARAAAWAAAGAAAWNAAGDAAWDAARAAWDAAGDAAWAAWDAAGAAAWAAARDARDAARAAQAKIIRKYLLM